MASSAPGWLKKYFGALDMIHRQLKQGLLSRSLFLALLCSAGVAQAQVILVPPPAPMYRVMPPPRTGYAWRPGYWAWQYGRYLWVPGHWVVFAGPPVYVAPQRAPAPAPQVQRISADALFPFDRGNLSDMLPAGRADVEQIAARLRNSRFDHIEVRGYTDPLGSDAYNVDLSERRANAVKALLVQQGIPAAKIRAMGLGKQDPIAQCDTQQPRAALVDCLQPDRRVEIVTYADDVGDDGDGRADGPQPGQ
jgi:OOP family OmpA-OmpF porin